MSRRNISNRGELGNLSKESELAQASSRLKALKALVEETQELNMGY
jgi:hypothetical protein